VGGHDGGTSVVACHRHAGVEAIVQDACGGCATHDGGEAELIAAGDEHAVGVFDLRCPVGIIAIGAALEVEGAGVFHAVFCELFLVPRAHVGFFGGGGDDGDDRLTSSAEFDEACEDGGVGEFAADGDEPAFSARLGRGHVIKLRPAAAGE
jgi:hypothetical protein